MLTILHTDFSQISELCNERKMLARRFTVLLLYFFAPVFVSMWFPIIVAFISPKILFNYPDKAWNLYVRISFLYINILNCFFVTALYGWNRFQRSLFKRLQGEKVDKVIDKIEELYFRG